MLEETIELLEPSNPNLTTPEQCVYREGIIYHNEGLNSKHMLEIIEMANKSNKTNKRAVITSFERMWDFSQGLDGKKLEKDGCKDYCKERCNIVSCEYKTNP